MLTIPGFMAAMAFEYRLQRRRVSSSGPSGPSGGDYEWRDTLVSLTMGSASLAVPLVFPRLLRPFALGRGRFAKALAAGTVTAALLTTAGDAISRRSRISIEPGDQPSAGIPGGGSGITGRRWPGERALARVGPSQVTAVGGVATVVMGGILASATWAAMTSVPQFWRHRLFGKKGTGPLALLAAVVGWDFVYYWNHRLSHERRFLWAVHVVHHSSERYNFSTALRQPVMDELGPCLPYGLLCLFGIAPETVALARSVNLLYQFWIHTETIGRLGRPEAVLNSPSHHRVHHGSNSRYLDRNYGSILIVWDRLFTTFEEEDEQVVYGLTTNLDTFDPGRVALHEHAAMLRGVARSTSWRERLSTVFRGPGWSHRNDAERSARLTQTTSEVATPTAAASSATEATPRHRDASLPAPAPVAGR